MTTTVMRTLIRRTNSSSSDPHTQSFCCTPLVLLISKQEVSLVEVLSKLQRVMFPARLSGDHLSSHQRIIGCRKTLCCCPKKAKAIARMRKKILVTRVLITVDKKTHLWSPTTDGNHKAVMADFKGKNPFCLVATPWLVSKNLAIPWPHSSSVLFTLLLFGTQSCVREVSN